MGPLSPEEWATRLEFREVAWGRGSRERGGRPVPLAARAARVRVRVTVKAGRPTDETGWLLLEDRGNELKAWLCWGLDDASLEDLVRMAHHRWWVEDVFQTMKGELGLDHFEGRTWNGLHHHASMVMAAHAYTQLRRLGKRPPKTTPRVLAAGPAAATAGPP